MSIWTWIQPVDRKWKVVSDHEKGMICVYNEKSDLILERKGLSKDEVEFIEKNFFEIVATNLSENRSNQQYGSEVKKHAQEFNPMYA